MRQTVSNSTRDMFSTIYKTVVTIIHLGRYNNIRTFENRVRIHARMADEEEEPAHTHTHTYTQIHQQMQQPQCLPTHYTNTKFQNINFVSPLLYGQVCDYVLIRCRHSSKLNRKWTRSVTARSGVTLAGLLCFRRTPQNAQNLDFTMQNALGFYHVTVSIHTR